MDTWVTMRSSRIWCTPRYLFLFVRLAGVGICISCFPPISCCPTISSFSCLTGWLLHLLSFVFDLGLSALSLRYNHRSGPPSIVPVLIGSSNCALYTLNSIGYWGVSKLDLLSISWKIYEASAVHVFLLVFPLMSTSNEAIKLTTTFSL